MVAFIVDNHVTLFCTGFGHTSEYVITVQRGQLEVFEGAVQQSDSGEHLLDPALHERRLAVMSVRRGSRCKSHGEPANEVEAEAFGGSDVEKPG